MAADTDLADALEAYQVCSEAAEDNEKSYKDDYRFWRLDEQWEEKVKRARTTEGQERPMFTFNRGPAFARQVVNDIRKNRPAIKCHPADSGADVETALVMQGIIRNINYASKGDIARDTAAECAVYGGFGFYRIDIEYACDDTYDKDIRLNRIVNPLSVKGDPYSTSADSLDWNMAFVGELMTPDAFKEAYPKADPVSFSGMDKDVKRDWTNGDDILVAEYWKRSKAQKLVMFLSDGKTVDAKLFEVVDPETGLSPKDLCESQGITVRGQRQIETYVVDQCILNGQEVLTDKVRWAGKYIPIIPVYGEEINIEGKRLFWSMLHRGRDAQTQFNYHETTATELYALSPRIPFIGEEGSFVDERWATANTQNHPYLEYKKGAAVPTRQPLDAGPMVGAMALSKSASDNLKATLGMYDASLGNKSNESSGIAIERRDQQSDVGNFHFTDNMSRAIACEGTQLLDLIPKVYTKGRIARVMGEDGAHQNVKLGPRQRPPMQQGTQPQQPMQPQQQPDPNAEPPKIGALEGVFDLTMGKYDITVEAGPSYTTQRQETVAVISELGRANPAIWQIGGDILVDNLDIKNGAELARRLKKMLPPQLQDGEQQLPPQVIQMIEMGKQTIAELTEQNQQLTQENNQLKKDEVGKIATIEKAKTDRDMNDVKRQEIGLERQLVPVKDNQAKAQLLLAQEKLLMTQAQMGATGPGEHKGMPSMDAGAAGGIQPIANTVIQGLAELHRKVDTPKRKRMTIRKVNGGYEGFSEEIPDQPAQSEQGAM